MQGFSIKSRDIIALATLISCTYLLACGKDTIVGYTLLGVVCGYFGVEIVPPIIRRRKNGGK